MLVQCEAGPVSVTGTPGAAGEAGIPAADIAAGMCRVLGCASRHSCGAEPPGGAGPSRSRCWTRSWSGWGIRAAPHDEHGGNSPARTGLAHAVIAPYDVYPTADGGQVLLAVQNRPGSGGGWPNSCWDDRSWGPTPTSRPTRSGW
ncbi:CoA transferase [Streptomyces sp. L7]